MTAVSSEINKSEIVRQGAVGPLLNLTKSHDGRVQRNAAGALLNLTHIGQPASYVRTLVCTFTMYQLLEIDINILSGLVTLRAALFPPHWCRFKQTDFGEFRGSACVCPSPGVFR